MEKIRLQKFLAQSGIASRRHCEQLIKLGQIKINGQVATKMGIQIDPALDLVEYKNTTIKPTQKYIYYILNKPAGYTTTCADPFAIKTVLDLVPANPRVFPVGRLDKDSCGLLILTNDGQLTDELTHPRYEHEKEYQVKALVIKNIERSEQDLLNDLNNLEKGVILDDRPTSPAKLSQIQISLSRKVVQFNITIKEGRNRQIRRMCDLIDLKVTDLKRIRIGKLSLKDLPKGQYKEIHINDIM